MAMTAITTTTTNHDDQLGEIYPTMLNELSCTFGVSFSRFHFIAMAVMVMVCGRHGIGPIKSHLKMLDSSSHVIT